jgi:hypothetical protein
MKHFIAIGAVLAASQCPTTPPGGEETKTDATTEVAADAGTEKPEKEAAADAGKPDVAPPSTAWLEAGPPPFDVPTHRIELPGLMATMLAPIGTDVEETAEGVTLRLGEGKNFWLDVSDAAVDLDEVRELQESETEELVDRWEDAVVWNEGDRWFFQYSGNLSCANPSQARHDVRDVEVMIAACQSLEASGDGGLDTPGAPEAPESPEPDELSD